MVVLGEFDLQIGFSVWLPVKWKKEKRIRDDLFWMYCVIGWQESERKKKIMLSFIFFFLIFNIFLGEVTFSFVYYNFLILFYKPCHL